MSGEAMVDVPEDIVLTKPEMELLNKLVVSDELTLAEMDQVELFCHQFLSEGGG